MELTDMSLKSFPLNYLRHYHGAIAFPWEPLCLGPHLTVVIVILYKVPTLQGRKENEKEGLLSAFMIVEQFVF